MAAVERTQKETVNDLLTGLMRDFDAYLRATCRKRCECAGLGISEADGLVNETWWRVSRRPQSRWPALDQPDEWKKFLRTIARNLCCDLLRKEVRRKGPEREYAKRNRKRQPADTSCRLRAVTPQEALQSALEKLPDHRHRKVVRLRTMGFTWSETAERLGISESTAKAAWSAALGLLRDELEV
jgi:RNA polymerase sigma factor (sigma-70 family)